MSGHHFFAFLYTAIPSLVALLAYAVVVWKVRNALSYLAFALYGTSVLISIAFVFRDHFGNAFGFFVVGVSPTLTLIASGILAFVIAKHMRRIED